MRQNYFRCALSWSEHFDRQSGGLFLALLTIYPNPLNDEINSRKNFIIITIISSPLSFLFSFPSLFSHFSKNSLDRIWKGPKALSLSPWLLSWVFLFGWRITHFHLLHQAWKIVSPAPFLNQVKKWVVICLSCFLEVCLVTEKMSQRTNTHLELPNINLLSLSVYFLCSLGISEFGFQLW